MPDIKRGFGRGVDVAQEQAAKETSVQVPPWLKGGGMTKDVSFAQGSNTATIQHKLGRKPQGWLTMRLRQTAGDSNVFFEGEMDDKRLVLTRDSVSADPCTVDVWVY